MKEYKTKEINPLTGIDVPDIDVIRVDDTYYMIQTSMYFMPGAEIFRSYDLVHWEHFTYVYDRLDSTPKQRLSGEENAYGQGMWAASFRYHKGTFYICFVANDTGKTYLFTAQDPAGPWKKQEIEGFYHDCSLLFDEDRVFIAYGNRYIHILELKTDLSGPLPGGLDRIAVSEEGNPSLAYEGTHFYKRNGKYYLLFIHSLWTEWRRVEACFVADSIDGEFIGGDCFNDDMGYCNQGIAQGCIIDTPEGDWYALLFQDRGAVGRIPVLMPVTWENDVPVFGDHGKLPETIQIKGTREGHEYLPLVGSDDFKGTGTSQEYGSFGLKSRWQFNHEPELSLVCRDSEKGTWTVTTGKLCKKLTQAQNTITQRMYTPGCAGSVTVTAAMLKEGDYAGLCALQSSYAMAALTKRDGKLVLVMRSIRSEEASMQGSNAAEETEWQVIPWETESVELRAEAEFEMMKDEVTFYYRKAEKDRVSIEDEEWKKLGETHKMYFKLDHFTGYRFGLFVYATKETGGSAVFEKFVYEKK